MPGTLVGRDAALESAAAALDSTGRVLLESVAGIGKTSLLRALLDLATGQACSSCTVRPPSA